jgi:ferredoxin-type protein NapH
MTIQIIRRTFSYTFLIVFHVFQMVHLFMSPVLIVFAAQKGIVNGSFVIFSLLLLTSLFLGRAFCSWICPGMCLQELISFLVHKKTRNNGGLKVKYFISLAWILCIVVLYTINGFRMIDVSYGIHGYSLTRTLMLSFGVFALTVPMALFFGQWASCKYICWIAPLLITGIALRRFLHIPSLQLVANRAQCIECKSCDKHCPMNLEVTNWVKQRAILGDECILCGQCIDNCKKKAIRYAFTKKGLR